MVIPGRLRTSHFPWLRTIVDIDQICQLVSMISSGTARHIERLGLLIGGAFIALGAQIRGWIDYTQDWEFWLTPIIIICFLIGRHYDGRASENKEKESKSLESDFG